MKEKQQQREQTKIPVSLIHDLTTFALYWLLDFQEKKLKDF